MVSAPAAMGSAPRRRRAGSAPVNARSHSASPRRAGSAPARLSASPNPRVRRAFSASPGVRRWNGPRSAPRPARRARRGVGRLAKIGTSLLALQGALSGRVNAPYVGASGKALAVWPLGSRGPVNNLGLIRTMRMNYPYALSKYPAVERGQKRRPETCGRKACLGGQPNSSLYDPKMSWVKLNASGGVPRKFGDGTWANVPRPVISAANVLRFEAQGYQFPKSVLKQAHAGLPITGNYKLSNRTLAALAAKDLRMLPALIEAGMPIPSRFNKELPANMARKLLALEGRARSVAGNAALKATVKAAVAPWAIAAKARNVTGKVAGKVATKVGQILMAPVHAGRSVSARFHKARRAAHRLPN